MQLSRGGYGFLNETAFALRVGDELRGKDFKSDFAIEIQVEIIVCC